MGGSCNTYGRDEKCMENLNGRHQLEDLRFLEGVKVWTEFIWIMIGASG